MTVSQPTPFSHFVYSNCILKNLADETFLSGSNFQRPNLMRLTVKMCPQKSISNAESLVFGRAQVPDVV